MASKSFELEPAEEVSVTTIGEPGQRQFYLLASGGGQHITLACEKFHVEGLVTRIKQLLEAHGLPSSAEESSVGGALAGEPDWRIAELGLGYHEERGQFVIVAREEVEGEQEAATARLWTGPDEIRRFLHHAAQVLTAGRPTCPRCGLPMDPAGHPCPALNGSRPVF